jgi:hypothetical protein
MQGILEQAGAAWSRLNRREQVLAGMVGAMVLLMACWSIVAGAAARLDLLAREVDQLQSQILNSKRQILMRKSVEERYASVAAQHSSAWDQYEVYERLRQEIFRLAQKVPPPLNADGVPERATSDTGELVRIPELRQGTMTDTEDGYREYKISFRIPEAELSDVFAFLERLQASPQSLRIDGLVFSRGWDNTITSTTIDLTRIIVDGGNIVAPDSDVPEEQDLTPVDIAPERWVHEGGLLKASGGGVTLEATPADERATLYMEAALPAQRTAEVVLHLAATGRGMIGVADGEDMLFPGAERLPDDGKPHEIRFLVTVPGKAGEVVTVRLPYLTISGEGSRVEVLGVAYEAFAG